MAKTTSAPMTRVEASFRCAPCDSASGRAAIAFMGGCGELSTPVAHSSELEPHKVASLAARLLALGLPRHALFVRCVKKLTEMLKTNASHGTLKIEYKP
jgi:hypothetical protein